MSRTDSLPPSGGQSHSTDTAGRGATNLVTQTPRLPPPLLPGRLFSAKCESTSEPMQV